MTIAKDVMISNVISVTPDTTVETVFHLLVEHRISGIPVLNDNQEAVGFISDGDILKRIGHKDKNTLFSFISDHLDDFWDDSLPLEEKLHLLRESNVMTIATSKVVTVTVNTDIKDVAKVLSDKRIKKVPVTKNNKVVGIISRGDLVRHIFKTFPDKRYIFIK